jgi:hypothetical protein
MKASVTATPATVFVSRNPSAPSGQIAARGGVAAKGGGIIILQVLIQTSPRPIACATRCALGCRGSDPARPYGLVREMHGLLDIIEASTARTGRISSREIVIELHSVEDGGLDK